MKRATTKKRARYGAVTVVSRYVPVLVRAECPACGHWGILQNGICSGCRAAAHAHN
jgi:hypothetical protein